MQTNHTPRRLFQIILKEKERDIGHQGNRTGQKDYTLMMMMMMTTTTYGEVIVYLHAFLLSVLDEGSSQLQAPAALPLEKKLW
jgi:hypothetical protein